MGSTLPSAADFADLRLAEIASTLPGATMVLREQKLDCCADGLLRLAEAAAANGIDLDGLTQKLRMLARPVAPPELPDDPVSLIAVIETRYHAVHRREFQELIALARHVEAVHSAHPRLPCGLAALLRQMAGELEVHMKKEELILFPRMRRGGDTKLEQPITSLMADHDGHAAQLGKLRHAMQDFTAPDDACPAWHALCLGARKLDAELTEHIQIENKLLFPRFTP